MRRAAPDKAVMLRYLDYIVSALATDDAKEEAIKKQLRLVKSKANIHKEHAPAVDADNHLIYGVINGGRFGRHGMMGDAQADAAADDKVVAFGKEKTILRYYFFLLYLPLNHNEGFFAIHSNSKEETVTDMMKTFVRRLFKGDGYISPRLYQYCPKVFREEFIQESYLKEMVFRDTVADKIFTPDTMHHEDDIFDIEVKIRPRSKALVPDENVFNRIMKRLGLSRPGGTYTLDTFRSIKAKVNNPYSESDRSFEINSESIDDIVPVVYLDNRIKKYNDDNTPDFGELSEFCRKMFLESILPEIHPDRQQHENND